MNMSTPEEKVEGAQFMQRIPPYDISQKVREANEALKKDDTPSRETKPVRVKFGPILVHYEPETANSSDTAWGETEDSANNVSDKELNGCNDDPSYSLLSGIPILQKKQTDAGSYYNTKTPSLMNANTPCHFSVGSSIRTMAEYNTADLENKPCRNISNSFSQIELQELDQNNVEISLSDFSEILNDMEFNEVHESEDKTERISVDEGMGREVFHENVGMTTVSIAEKREHEVSFDKKGDSEKDYCISTQEETIDEQFAFSSEEFIGILQHNESHFDKQECKYVDGEQDEEDINHQNQPSFASIKDDDKANVLQKSQQKYLMHHKWSNARLPTYNGLYSEYGLTAEMLEERKRKAEIIRQKLWEKKKQEEEIKEQKKKENDESFREWLRKKEAERKKSAEEKKDHEFIYDHQEAENAFQDWLKRKAKELRQQKKQNEVQRDYEKKLVQRRTYDESQKEFKRWLRAKMKKSSPPGKHKSNTFSSMRKSYKRYAVEKNMHMKNTCKIYLGN